jgi:hypothetical protein
MKLPLFPRIWPSRPGCPNRRGRRRESGTATLVVVFLCVVFSGLGLSLAYLTGVYSAVGRHRKSFTLAGLASENAVKLGYAGLLRRLETAPAPLVLSDQDYERLEADAAGRGVAAAEAAVEAAFPLKDSGGCEDASWSSETGCAWRGFADRGAWFGADFDIAVDGQGSVRGSGASRRSSLAARLGVAAGRLPLAAFPVLVDRPLSPADRAGFLERNGVEIAAEPGNPSPPASFGDGSVIPADATGLLCEALKVEMFEPQSIPPARLRAALGLPESNDPVPDAVYLVRDDLGLGGIYVQGDVEEMIAAVDGDAQVLLFRLSEGEWMVRFSPAARRTEFVSPGASEIFDGVPVGLVIVRGAVAGLGGGRIGGDGRPVLDPEGASPSLLAGVQITIVSSERVSISAPLVRQGLRWQEGIPYLEDKDSQLVIYSTGRDFVSGEETEGGVVIGAGAPRDLRIDASVAAAGDGLKIEGGGRTVRVTGGVQAADIDARGNRLVVTPLAQGRGFSLPAWSPISERPLLRVIYLRPESWTEPS